MVKPNASRLLCSLPRLLLVAGLLASPALAEEGQPLASSLAEQVVVTARRAPTTFEEVTRRVVVIDRQAIEAAPVEDLAGLLEYVAGIDVRQRGPRGVQADVSIRGATFEQTLLVLDGVKMIDPQTGHFSFDLPISLDDIERVEILAGPGSRLYGPNAFGGVINVITRRATGAEIDLEGAAGSFTTRRARASLGASRGAWSHRVLGERNRSGGWRENSDYRVETVSLRSRWAREGNELRLAAGRTTKAFGARDFYTDRFPRQWEATATDFASAAFERNADRWRLQATGSYRAHDDEFLLDRDDPGFYRNLTRSKVLAAEIHASRRGAHGVTSMGAEWGIDRLDSSSLGDHRRARGGLYVEHEAAVGQRGSIVLGGFAYRYSDWGSKLWPGLEAGYRLAPGTRLYASVERAFRVPTYTELYYASPANRGNPELQPETALTYEAGVRHRGRTGSFDLAFFARDARRVIDWVLDEPSGVWQAMNLTDLRTVGLEWSGSLSVAGRRLAGLPLEAASLSYTWLDVDKNAFGRTSRYALDHLEHKAVAALRHRWGALPITQSWSLRWERRVAGQSVVLLDARAAWPVGRMELVLAGTNLLDREYIEGGFVPAPGRYIELGLRWRAASAPRDHAAEGRDGR